MRCNLTNDILIELRHTVHVLSDESCDSNFNVLPLPICRLVHGGGPAREPYQTHQRQSSNQGTYAKHIAICIKKLKTEGAQGLLVASWNNSNKCTSELNSSLFQFCVSV